jgi:hypothetical protein
MPPCTFFNSDCADLLSDVKTKLLKEKRCVYPMERLVMPTCQAWQIIQEREYVAYTCFGDTYRHIYA